MFTYDVTTDIGRVRRTIPDKVADEAFWSDEEIQSFLDDEDGWRRAAALALETMAADAAMVMQVITINDIKTDGASVARALLGRAATLREQAAAGEDSFDIIEMTYDNFSWQDIVIHDALRRP